MKPTILILNGPNLNMLGRREPGIYGSETLETIATLCTDHATKLGYETEFRQSNLEGELVTWIQQSGPTAAGIAINAGAYTHTSVAIRDALLTTGVPIVEVHLSNIYRREPFRHTSYISDIADGVICGFGSQGYVMAIDAIHRTTGTADATA
jgi:3-dehydroquinate dehydratase-2